MIFKGPLAKLTLNIVIVTLLICASVALFAVESIRRDSLSVDKMMADIPAIIEIYNTIIEHPKFDTVTFTQDGNITLFDTEDKEIAELKLTNERQIEALCNIKSIYRDDYGVNFSYSNNHFSTVARTVFSGKSMEDIKNKKSENETVTKITNGVYMIVYRFDYERFFNREEIFLQIESFINSIILGAEGVFSNEQ